MFVFLCLALLLFATTWMLGYFYKSLRSSRGELGRKQLLLMRNVAVLQLPLLLVDIQTWITAVYQYSFGSTLICILLVLGFLIGLASPYDSISKGARNGE